MAGKALTILILTMTALVSVHSLMFPLTSNEPTCLKIRGNNTYNIEYVVSGENDRNVKMEVFDNGQFILRRENTNDFQQLLKFSGAGSVCFTRTDSKPKSISFDCFLEADPYKEIIDKKDILIAINSLQKSISLMKEVGRNQKFHIERNEINRAILQ